MNSFEKSVINSALSAYSAIKGISSIELTTLQNKVNNTTDNQCKIFDITNFNISLSSGLTFDYVNSNITNSTGGTLTTISYETDLKDITIKSFKILTNDGILTDFKIEICTNYSDTTPTWNEINKDELYLQIFNNDELRFRISIPSNKSLNKIYMIYEN